MVGIGSDRQRQVAKGRNRSKGIFGLSCSNRHFKNEQGYESYKAWKNERNVMPGVADKAIGLSEPHTPS
jgi:hypothetical protein